MTGLYLAAAGAGTGTGGTDASGTPFEFWIAFNGVVLSLLLLDLFVFHRGAHAVSMKEAVAWSIFWVSLSLAFGGFVWHWKGAEKALQFFTGYVIEYSLSVDNIFIFVLIFTYFQVPPQFQYRVLFWGIMGAFIMRGIMIGLGALLISQFHWILYVFGALLIISGYKMLRSGEEEVHLETNPILRMCKRYLPISPKYDGANFTTYVEEPVASSESPDGATPHFRKVWKLTPLALVLIVVEFTDLLFAVDSIPAIFAVTTDPFIVYTSNVCAILGLRSLYFLLAGIMDKFSYLKVGLGLVLTFVGTKMLFSDVFHIPPVVSLFVVVGILAVAIIASLIKSNRDERRRKSGIAPGSRRAQEASARKILEAAGSESPTEPPVPNEDSIITRE